MIDDDGREPAPVEAGAVAGMTGTAFLMDLDQHGVAVAVEPNLADPLPVTTGLTLHPVLPPTAREEGGAPSRQGLVEGHVVHPADHQNLSREVFLDDGGNQAGGVALEQRGDLRVKRAAGDGRRWVGHAPIVPTPFAIDGQLSDPWRHCLGLRVALGAASPGAIDRAEGASRCRYDGRS